jgi:tetratricopeptide (TPR) repeat protein
VDVRGYHIWNIAIHLCCALLVFGIVRRTLESSRAAALFSKDSANIALAVALIWALHPLNSEAVNYIVQRTESMVALFYLLTLYSAIRAIRSPRPTIWHVASVAACALGMGCKESMVTAPFMVVLYDRVFERDATKIAGRSRLLFYFALASTWLILAGLLMSAPRAGTVGLGSGISPWVYLLNQTMVISRYLWLTIWPHSLVVFYGWPLSLNLLDVWPYAALLVGLAVLTVVGLVRQPVLGFLGVWFFVTLAPASSLVPVATEVGAERRMYLPLVALAVLAVVLFYKGASLVLAPRQGRPNRAVLVSTLALVSLALAVRTITRNIEYASSVVLARTIVERRPTSVAHHLLGQELLTAGAREEGVRELREAIGGDSKARYLLGLELFSEGQWPESINQLKAFVQTSRSPVRLVPHWLEPTKPELIKAQTIISRGYMSLQQWPQAAEEARVVLALDAASDDAYGLLADASFGQGKFEEAVEYYTRYLQLRPNELDALARLGSAQAALNKPQEALATFSRAVQIDPTSGDAQRNLATALLDAHEIDKAMPHAREAVRLRPGDPMAHALLGRTLAAQRTFDEAIIEFRRALQLDPNDAESRDEMARITRLKNR